MKHKHIEASREARLWIGQVIVPIAGIVLAVAATDTKHKITSKLNDIKESIAIKFKKD